MFSWCPVLVRVWGQGTRHALQSHQKRVGSAVYLFLSKKKECLDSLPLQLSNSSAQYHHLTCLCELRPQHIWLCRDLLLHVLMTHHGPCKDTRHGCEVPEPEAIHQELD